MFNIDTYDYNYTGIANSTHVLSKQSQNIIKLFVVSILHNINDSYCILVVDC